MRVTSQMFLCLIWTKKKRLARKELENGCGCPHNGYSQFPEGEMYSIQLQMAELELEHGMHTCPYPASNIYQTLNCYFSKLSFVHQLVLRNIRVS